MLSASNAVEGSAQTIATTSSNVESQPNLQSPRSLASPTRQRMQAGYEPTPSISVSSEAPISTSGRSEDCDHANDEDRIMEVEGSTAGEEDEDVGEELADGENATVEKTAAERWADKRKMKRFRCVDDYSPDHLHHRLIIS